jgi:hypothetical protein
MTHQLILDSLGRDNPFSYDNATPKETATGLRFKTYRGLRKYLVTGSKQPLWLRAVSPEDFEHLCKNSDPYVYVENLDEIMDQALTINIARLLMINLVANPETEVIWGESEPQASETAWLETVRRVIAKM